MTMTAQTLPLTMFYKGWDTYQQRLVNIIAPLSPAQLAFRVTPQHWSIGMVAQHLVANRVWWFYGWMGEGTADLLDIAHWDPGYDAHQPPRDAAELVAGLETTWRVVADALARWTPADLDTRFPPEGFLPAAESPHGPERTRQWIIWHLLEHEIHHGGELSVALGMCGLEGIYGTL